MKDPGKKGIMPWRCMLIGHVLAPVTFLGQVLEHITEHDVVPFLAELRPPTARDGTL